MVGSVKNTSVKAPSCTQPAIPVSVDSELLWSVCDDLPLAFLHPVQI